MNHPFNGQDQRMRGGHGGRGMNRGNYNRGGPNQGHFNQQR